MIKSPIANKPSKTSRTKLKNSMESAMLKDGGVLYAQSGLKLKSSIPSLKYETSPLLKSIISKNNSLDLSLKNPGSSTQENLNLSKGFEKGSLTDTNENKKGSEILKNIKGFLTSTNKSDLANLAMYINTLASNKKSTDAQMQAAQAGVVQIPTLEKRYIRIATPNLSLVEKQATGLQSEAKNIASNLSDVDKGIAARLQANEQAANMRLQSQASAQEYIDKLKAAQMESDADIAARNLEIIKGNRMSQTQADQQNYLLASNLIAANATALNNLIYGFGENLKVSDMKRNRDAMYKLVSDPEMKKLYDEYNKLGSEEGMRPYKTAYEESQKGTNIAKKSWESSDQYKA